MKVIPFLFSLLLVCGCLLGRSFGHIRRQALRNNGNQQQQQLLQDDLVDYDDDDVLDDDDEYLDFLGMIDSNELQQLYHQSRHLQRVASICAEDPTPFSTSFFITLNGDDQPFQQPQLQQILELTLQTYNELNAQQCDPTYRTLTGVNVGEVFYTDSLDYIRLRFDVNGSCAGCLVTDDLDSGIGPLFGAAEQTPPPTLRQRQRKRQILQHIEPESHGSSSYRKLSPKPASGIKGAHNNHRHRYLDHSTGDLLEEEDISSRQKNDKKGKGNRVCECDNDDLAEEDYRGPTALEFQEELNSAILAARQNQDPTTRLTGVTSVAEIFEAGVAGRSTVVANDGVREVGSCAPADNVEFVTTVWVEITGDDLEQNEKIPMEVALLETFNEMNLLSCDTPFFRRVTAVKYQETRANGVDKLQMRFDVEVKCVNCDPATLQLFDTSQSVEDTIDAPALTTNTATDTTFRPPSRSRLVSEIDRLEDELNRPVPLIRQVYTSCVCPLNQDSLPLRPPNTREFADILQSTVQALEEVLLITSVQQVIRVAEGEIDVECAEPTPFVSTVFVDFDGSPRLLTDDEVSALEGGFKDTYNELVLAGCDQYFRTVNQVRLIPGITRRRRSLQGTSTGNAANASDVVDLQSELPSVYMVAGSCRGCPVTNSGTFTMYDDGFRLRKLLVNGELLPQACYSYASARRTPLDFAEAEISDGDFGTIAMEQSGDVFQEHRRLQDCVCPLGAIPDTPFAPKVEDFRSSYNVKITELSQQGLVTNVRSVLALSEVPPLLSIVAFSIFYGSQSRIGTPSGSDYEGLVAQTGAFFRDGLFSHYEESTDVILRAVTVTRQGSTPRPDLDMIQVSFYAELIFEESSTQPSNEEILEVMGNLYFVPYISDYLWNLGNDNGFRTAHTIRFTGSEDVVVDVGLAFTVRSDRTNTIPSTQDREGLVDQINLFFMDVLKQAGLLVVSFEAQIDAEDISFANGVLQLNFDVKIVFSSEGEPPAPEVVLEIIQSADLDVFRTQYLGQTAPEGCDLFCDAYEITFNNAGGSGV